MHVFSNLDLVLKSSNLLHGLGEFVFKSLNLRPIIVAMWYEAHMSAKVGLFYFRNDRAHCESDLNDIFRYFMFWYKNRNFAFFAIVM